MNTKKQFQAADGAVERIVAVPIAASWPR